MIVILLICVFAIVILSSWLRLLQNCKDIHIAGPPPYPIIGNAHLFIGRPSYYLSLFQNLKDWYGDAVLVHILHNKFVILYHPKYIERRYNCLLFENSHDDNNIFLSIQLEDKFPGTVSVDIQINEKVMSRTDLITKGISYKFLKPWLGNGLLTSTGNRWKNHRKFLTPAFHFNILQNFLPVFLKNEKCLVKTLMKISGEPPVDLFPIIALNALDNVIESIMGVTINAQGDSDSKYVKSIETLTKLIAKRTRNPLLGDDAFFNLTPLSKIQENALKIVHGLTTDVIIKRRKELDNLNTDAHPETGRRNTHAFLDLLLLAEIDGKKICDEYIREEVDTFMFEGHDTTTSGISFALYILSKHPDVQEKLLEEQKRILGDDLLRDPTYSDLQQMKYLEHVIKESLRLYPPVPLIERMATEDTDIAGIRIKRNTSIVIDIYHTQRNPELFDNPLEFKPERFESQSTKNAFSWIAFSAGPRNCIGQKFAMMEMKITLAGVIKHFKLLPSNEQLVLCIDLILRSENGVKVHFKRR